LLTLISYFLIIQKPKIIKNYIYLFSHIPAGDRMIGLLAFAGMGICTAVWFIIWILVAIWVYKDAKKRNMSSPALWLIIVLLLNLIGLIIYIIVRPKEVQQTSQAPPPPPM